MFSLKVLDFGRHKTTGGFVLAEAILASGVMGLFVMASLSAILFDQVALRKAKEEAIAMDFITHYLECLKAQPFASLVGGVPINSLYNGVSGAPLVVIPSDNSWVSLTSVDFQTFDPDLLCLSNRNPKMRVTLTSNVVGGNVHDVEANVKIDWDSPLNKGSRLEVQADLFRTKDL